MKSEYSANLAIAEEESPSWTKATPKRGRPALDASEATKARSVRLNDSHWHRLKRLGSEWLKTAIDDAWGE